MSESIHTTPLQIAQRFLLHLGRGDISEVADLLSPTVTFRVLGHHAFAGVFIGPGQMARHLADVAERTKGTFDMVKWDDWLAGERHAAAIAHIHVQYEGRKVTAPVVLVVGMDVADTIVSVTVFFEDEGAIFRLVGPAFA